MSKFTQFVVLLLVLALVVTPFVVATVNNPGGAGGGGAAGGGAALTADNPLYTPSAAALSAVLNADNFEAPVYVLSDGVVSYRIGTSGGNRVGAAFVVSVRGFNPAGMVFLVGVDSSGAVSGVEIIQQNESADWWEMIEDAGFIGRLIGNTAGTAFDGVSGATVTARALYDGTQAALNYFVNNIQ